MDVFVIQGGSRLSGELSVSGSKNAVLPMMASALLAEGITTLSNVPNLLDIGTMASLLQSLGCDVERSPDNTCSISVSNETELTATYDLVSRMRASVCVLGPLLAKRGSAKVALPGGCRIGSRPIDLHLNGLAALGARIEIKSGNIIAKARTLHGANINLAGPMGTTVTGTCNVMSAATLARGVTTLGGAAMEPEVVALAEFLNLMGARISGHGSPEIRIEGVPRLTAVSGRVIPDRIEAATLMIAAAATEGDVTLGNVRPDHLASVIDCLRQMEVKVQIDADHRIRVSREGELRPIQITAAPYPGIPTDIQAQLTALFAVTPGQSSIQDSVFPDRFAHCAELIRMGADIQRHGNRASVLGVDRLQGTNVIASDLRASAALVIAGLTASGETTVHQIGHLDRGYDAFETRLNHLGANIIRHPEHHYQGRAA